MGVRLPAEYQEVEYLEREANGAYIALPIAKYNLADSDLYLDLAVISPTSGERAYVGSMQGYIDQESGGFPAWEGYFPSSTWQYAASQLTIEVVESTISTLSVRGQIHYRFSDAAYIALTLFQYRSGGYQCANRYYGVRIEKNGVITAKFVPCYRKSDSEPGMYDLVSKTFYTNQGTGEFLVGPDVVNHISPRLMDRRRALIAKLTSLFRKVITSQTGLASFDTNVAKPMKVTCEFSPKQDLHGYDNPWPAGGGVNIIPDGTDTSNGYQGYKYLKSDNTYSDITSGWYVSEYFSIDSSRQYVWSAKGTLVNQAICFYDQNKSFLDGVSGSDVTLPYTFNPPQGAAYCRASQATAPGNLVQIEVGTTATTPILPYSNICPISGHTGCDITGTRKNLFGGTVLKNAMMDAFSASNPIANGNIVTYKFLSTVGNKKLFSNFKPNIRYTFIITSQSVEGNSSYPDLAFFYTDGTVAAFSNPGSGSQKTTGVAVSASGKSLDYVGTYGAHYQSVAMYCDESGIFEGVLTTEDFVPYQGTSLPIPFNNPGTYDFLPVQAGTGDPSPENVRPITPGLTITRDDNTTLEVWGGSLTVNADGTGTITSKYYQCVYDGVNKKVNSSEMTETYIAASETYANPIGATGPGIVNYSDKFKSLNNYGYTGSYEIYTLLCNGAGRLYPRFFVGYVEGSGVTTSAECVTYVNNWFQSNPTSVAYKLTEADYQTYTLSVAETSRAFEALGLGKNLGPLYGGTVTVNEDGSVDVMADNGIGNFDPTKITAIDTNSGVRTGVRTARSNASFGGEFSYNGHIASDYIFDSLISRDNYTQGLGIRIINYTVYLTMLNEILDSSLSDADYIAAAIEYFTEHPVTGVLPLATPQTYHFDNIGQLQSFLGTNNVWSDLNGPITVEYYKKQQ